MTGGWLSLAGAFGLWLTLFGDWFAADPAGWVALRLRWSGWDGLGVITDVVLCVAMLAGVLLGGASLVGGDDHRLALAARLAIGAGTVAFVALPLAVLLADAAIRWPAVAGLLFAAMVPAGGWIALANAASGRGRAALT